MTVSDPAALASHDPRWAAAGEWWLARIAERLADLPGASGAAYDHIGSTSVPGLAAKPYVDLQVRISPLPADESLIVRLHSLGLVRAKGARPDSPGVSRDLPRGGEEVDAAVWQKSLFVHEGERVIVHIRRFDSPWGLYTVWFRDWLRAHPAERQRYEHVKRELSARERGKDDYDDYTRAKTAFFDEVQATFEAWAKR